MTYKLIIQELKESSDHNVRTFVREVEKMKRLSVEDRQFYLKHRQEKYAVDILVNDYIPYIIKVAYAHSKKSKSLSILDLINEGILGVCTALRKYHFEGKAVEHCIRNAVNRHISLLADKRDDKAETCYFVMDGSSQDEQYIINDVDREREMVLLKNLLSNKFRCRYAHIILDYYMNTHDLRMTAKKYGISRERVRQITNRVKLRLKGRDLWNLLSSDFNLPIGEASFVRH